MQIVSIGSSERLLEALYDLATILLQYKTAFTFYTKDLCL